MVKLTLLVVDEAAMKEYPMPCGGFACRVEAGVSVDVVEVAVVVPGIEAAALLQFSTTVVESRNFIAGLA